MKTKLKDELGQFSSTINEIEMRNENLLTTEVNETEYQTLFFFEIQKPLKDLEIKLKNLKSKTFRQFVDNSKAIKAIHR